MPINSYGDTPSLERLRASQRARRQRTYEAMSAHPGNVIFIPQIQEATLVDPDVPNVEEPQIVSIPIPAHYNDVAAELARHDREPETPRQVQLRRYQAMVERSQAVTANYTVDGLVSYYSEASFWNGGPRFRDKAENATTSEKLNIWIFENRKEKPIKYMSKSELKLAIKQIKGGWSCWNQQNKIVTLERVFKEKKNAAR